MTAASRMMAMPPAISGRRSAGAAAGRPPRRGRRPDRDERSAASRVEAGLREPFAQEAARRLHRVGVHGEHDDDPADRHVGIAEDADRDAHDDDEGRDDGVGGEAVLGELLRHLLLEVKEVARAASLSSGRLRSRARVMSRRRAAGDAVLGTEQDGRLRLGDHADPPPFSCFFNGLHGPR